MTENRLPALASVLPPTRGSTYPAAIIDGEACFPEAATQRGLQSPIDAMPLGIQRLADAELVDTALVHAGRAFELWRAIPAPRRSELVRRIAEEVRLHQRELARIITLETGKTQAEATGEVQEWIESCDFALGFSRQLKGQTTASEQTGQRVIEQWHPLGPVAIISAFNSPVASWAEAAMQAFVCGNPVIWKPSAKTPLCALAAQTLVGQVLADFDETPASLAQLLIGTAEVGSALVADPRVALVVAQGSEPVLSEIAASVGSRLGHSLLDPGYNNALIVTPSALSDAALRAIVFGAVGMAGQSTNALRNLFVHESIAAELVPKLIKAYGNLPIGDPRESGTLVGPLIDGAAFEAMQHSLDQSCAHGGRILFGGDRLRDGVPSAGIYARPAIVQIPIGAPLKASLTPILFLIRYHKLEEAVAASNALPGLHSSVILTDSHKEAEYFLAASQCGIANVNIGSETACLHASEDWKHYMRRSINTIGHDEGLPEDDGFDF